MLTFFDAARYPANIFKSSLTKADRTNKYKFTGKRTMDGVTKPVTKDLWYRGTKENLNSKKNNADFKLRGTLKRFDFNIGTNTPTVLVNDEIEIETDGEFAKANR